MPGLAKKTVLAAALAALISTAGYAATADTKNAQPKNESAKEVVARVDGHEITKYNLQVTINNLMPLMAFHSAVSDAKLKQIQKKALDTLIDEELLYKAAKADKEDNVDKKEIDDDIEKLKKGLPKGESLKAALKRSNMTMDDLREDVRRSIAVKKYSKKKTDEFQKRSEDLVTEAYMKDYYNKNLGKFKEPEQIKVRGILIKADPSGGQRIWNEARKKADELAKKARKGEDFAELAKKYSQDPYAEKGGDMGWAHRGSLFEELDAAASQMKTGQISEPIMTMYGYHVIKLEGIKPPVQRKFEEINQKQLKKDLEMKEYTNSINAWKKRLRDSAKIEYLTDIGKEIILP